MNRDPGSWRYRRRGWLRLALPAMGWLASLLPLPLVLSRPLAAQANPWGAPGGMPGGMPAGMPGTIAPWYPQPSFPQQTIPPKTYPQQTYPAQSYPQSAYPQSAYPQSAYPGATWPAPQQQAKPKLPAGANAQRQPTLDVILEAETAYVHQGLVVTLETVSDGNLSQIDVALPRSDAVIFRQIGTPSARAETRNGRRRIVNVRHYLLVPLQPGRTKLDPVRVDGTFAEGGSFEVTALRGFDIDVLPPDSHVEPWLPLHDLQLSAQLADDDVVDEGRPLKLVIEQKAVGMVGNQLPSPESQLAAAGHQLYRDSSDFEATISADGRLTGSRVDRFTLVPLKSGVLDIPQVAVTWWNVDKKRREQSIIPSRRLQTTASGGDSASGSADTGIGQGSHRIPLEAPLIWIGIVAGAFLAGLGWRRLSERLQRWDTGLFHGRFAGGWHTFRRLVNASFAHAFGPVVELAGATRRRLSPRRLYHRSRTGLADSLPRPLRLWFCVRAVRLEHNPDDWASVLRFVLEKRLAISGQKPMGQLARQLADIHPGSDRQQLERLLRQLEAASFGRVPLGDFEAWKREFMRQIRPHPWTWFRGRGASRIAGGLPALNPELE
jgi:hypothetical protein